MKYLHISKHCQEYSVEFMCRMLGVSRSGYYCWQNNGESPRSRSNRALVIDIKAAFTKNREVYGSPRITQYLNQTGISCGENRVAKLMSQNDIIAKQSKKFKPKTTDSKHNLPIAENLLNQDFTATKPFKKLVGDITYIPTMSGWLYLAVVIDLFSRKVVGWALSNRINAELVCAALTKAVGDRKFDNSLIFHSDRGSQYASHKFHDLLVNHGIRQSMSAKGNCYDNAVCESFFHSFKVEEVYLNNYTTGLGAAPRIRSYIEEFYNSKRLHSTLNYKTPAMVHVLSLAA
ncbi:MAG: IS3 family transposase [Deltaproteobacteria bacterium]|nr:IS3 family transposase [Deltaproteobacteria bacterium]